MLQELTGRVRDVRTLKRLFEAAEGVAAADGQDLPGPEHVIIGATRLGDGSASRALAAAGLDPEDLEGAVRRAHARALGLDGDDGPVGAPVLPRSSPARITGAGERFLRRIHDVHMARGGRLTGALVVLAAADLDAGVWPRVLAAAGIRPEDLRAAAEAEL